VQCSAEGGSDFCKGPSESVAQTNGSRRKVSGVSGVSGVSDSQIRKSRRVNG
jgi:hypothetical protein